jgi:hypothetical protein
MRWDCPSSASMPGMPKAALKMQINKSDPNDAVGIARVMQCGWYKEVRVKDLDSHAIKALLVSRALLVKIKGDIENQIRGLLKNLGLVCCSPKRGNSARRSERPLWANGRHRGAGSNSPSAISNWRCLCRSCS